MSGYNFITKYYYFSSIVSLRARIRSYIDFFLSFSTNSNGSLVGKIIGNRVTSTSIIRFTDANRLGKVCEVSEQRKFRCEFSSNHSLSLWGKGAYGINFLRVYASQGAINSRHRNGGKVYSKRRRITPINYETARREEEGIERERGRRKCKFRSRRSVVGEERRRCRGFYSRLRRRNTSLETISPRRGEVLLL